VAERERRAVFLDRDGTLIADTGYLADPDAVRLLPGARPALAELSRQGFALVVVSNQSGLGRGLIQPEQARAVHDRFVGELAAGGVTLDAVLYCPHTAEAGCPCRKPLPGMLLQAAEGLGLWLEQSVMVGDKASDVEAGHRAGCRTVLLGTGQTGDVVADCVARDWAEVLEFILSCTPGG